VLYTPGWTLTGNNPHRTATDTPRVSSRLMTLVGQMRTKRTGQEAFQLLGVIRSVSLMISSSELSYRYICMSVCSEWEDIGGDARLVQCEHKGKEGIYLYIKL